MGYANINNIWMREYSYPYSIFNEGIYSINATYTWGSPIQTALTNFNISLIDPCLTNVFPSLLANYTVELGGPDSYIALNVWYAYGYSFCTVSATVTVFKLTAPDTTTSLFTYSNIVDAN